MDLSVTYEYKSEPGGVQVAWFEDCDALVEYQLTWVPGFCRSPPESVPSRVLSWRIGNTNDLRQRSLRPWVPSP